MNRLFARGLIVSCALSSVNAHADLPPAGSVAFSLPAYAGTGCPTGSVALNRSPDNQAFTLLFDRFVVEGAAGGGPQRSAECIVDVFLEVPAGWSFAVLSVDTRGYASLATRQVRVDVTSRISIGSNSGNAASGALRLRGPYDDDFQIRAEVRGSSGRWSSCTTRRHRVRIDTSVRLKREAVTAVDSLDGQVQSLALGWRHCD